MKNIINIILSLLLVFLIGFKITLVVNKSSKVNHELVATVTNSDVIVDNNVNDFMNYTNDSYVVSYNNEPIIEQSKVYIHNQNSTIQKYNSIDKMSINNYLDGNMLIYSSPLDIYTNNQPYYILLFNSYNLNRDNHSSFNSGYASCALENDT